MASGNSLGMLSQIPDGLPATNYPQFTTRNQHPLLAFDATTQETAYWDLVLPSSYAGGGLTFIIGSVAGSATSGTVGWGVSVEKGPGTDYDADNFGTESLGTPVTVDAASGKPSTQTLTVSQANCGSPVAGDKLRIRIRRDVANDTATGDAQLDWVEVRET